MIANILSWYLCVFCILMYPIFLIADRYKLNRGVDNIGPSLRRYFDRSMGFFLLAWGMHYFPFFTMGRQLFLHHYLPAYIFSVIFSILFMDSFGCRLHTVNLADNIPLTQLGRGQTRIGYYLLMMPLLIGFIWNFWYFSPLCYGTGFDSIESVNNRKWFGSWDIMFATK